MSNERVFELCLIMSTTIDELLLRITYWYNTKQSTLTKIWITSFMLLVIYFVIIVVPKLTNCVINFVNNDLFNELYRSTEENNTIKCISIIQKEPRLINRVKYPEGYTPFQIACANSNTQLVKYMLAMGADISKFSLRKESPFYLAAASCIRCRGSRNATCIRELYYAGADINAPNEKGINPLQMAAMFGHTPLVRWLLLKNANIDIYPHPYIIAKSQGHQETAMALWRQLFAIDYK